MQVNVAVCESWQRSPVLNASCAKTAKPSKKVANSQHNRALPFLTFAQELAFLAEHADLMQRQFTESWRKRALWEKTGDLLTRHCRKLAS